MKQDVVTVGLDLAKNVFQVHAVGEDGAVLVRRKLRRAEVLGFFAEFQAASSAWRHVHQRIIGRAS